MQLFFAPMACSLASRIALYEADIPATFERVRLDTKRLDDGGDFRAISQKGQVPALRLDDGTVLTENPAVLQYIADLKPEAEIVPPSGLRSRYDVQSWLNYVSTELHKQILALNFTPGAPQAGKDFVRGLIPAKLAFLDAHLATNKFLVGDRFSVADGYLTWALALLAHIGIPLKEWPAVAAYFQRVLERPAVKRAFADEQKLM
jgi:glutathione S-transferase